eukprot:tig00020614_g12123.t2
MATPDMVALDALLELLLRLQGLAVASKMFRKTKTRVLAVCQRIEHKIPVVIIKQGGHVAYVAEREFESTPSLQVTSEGGVGLGSAELELKSLKNDDIMQFGKLPGSNNSVLLRRPPQAEQRPPAVGPWRRLLEVAISDVAGEIARFYVRVLTKTSDRYYERVVEVPALPARIPASPASKSDYSDVDEVRCRPPKQHVQQEGTAPAPAPLPAFIPGLPDANEDAVTRKLQNLSDNGALEDVESQITLGRLHRNGAFGSPATAQQGQQAAAPAPLPAFIPSLQAPISGLLGEPLLAPLSPASRPFVGDQFALDLPLPPLSPASGSSVDLDLFDYAPVDDAIDFEQFLNGVLNEDAAAAASRSNGTRAC